MLTRSRRGHDTTTRDEILGHALELFGTGGYAKTSLRDIADRMGFTKAALYYHYRSKDDLLVDLFEPALQEGESIVERHPKLRARAARESFLAEYFDFLWKHRLLLCHVACDLAVLSTPVIGERVVNHVNSVVDALVAGNRTDAARNRARSAFGALQAPITLADLRSDVSTIRRIAVTAALAVLASS